MVKYNFENKNMLIFKPNLADFGEKDISNNCSAGNMECWE